ncbi:tetratricopeptide repeat protein [Gordonia polyisoprenivorans]|uniref:tetratricopeptide repeat protein n=1 Tax=Gordonia polyisoprenivorans TaxID=84595 RepID=UPI001AD60951|nr:hypothetical protein [Gordonia polyisoprenivorans]QTI70519.1 hypothetical protein J6U32_08195 [Gordonia polyisoprenivorans]
MDDYYDLGSYTRAVTTTSPDAQLWFDRGLIWSYGFNHEESVACFERALAADPLCALAHWGIAYALGPNYNKPWEFFDADDLTDTVARSHRAVTRAQELASSATAVEAALIGALQFRYPAASLDGPAGDADTGSVWNHDYAIAMREVHRRFPEDLDVAALFADALMNLTPWELWDIRTGEPAPGSHAVEAQQVLDAALELPGGATHPGLLHMYIHLVEMSASPESGLAHADALRDLVPDAGHLQHMPTHLDVLCGDYRRVVTSNARAVLADEKFLRREGPMNFYTLYRCHDYHFQVYGAMFSAQLQVALDVAARLEATIPEELLREENPPMADWLEGFLGVGIHVDVRFGRWQHLINRALPADPDLYCATTAMVHYGKGVAHSALGHVDDAERERERFIAALSRVAPTRTLFNNTCSDILAVAGAMLDGELEYRKGNHDNAFAHLRRAIELDDTLPYDEPWGWMQPTRHAYGALLLEQDHVSEAAAVYRADLGLDDTLPRPLRHPGNIWALHGYHECLTRLGHHGDAENIRQQLEFAQTVADVPVVASCLCRWSV